MGCGCSKSKRKKTTLPVTRTSVSTNRVIGLEEATSIVRARCNNCVGLLRTDDGRYLSMQNGEYYEVTMVDVVRWRSQGWFIEIRS